MLGGMETHMPLFLHGLFAHEFVGFSQLMPEIQNSKFNNLKISKSYL
jgi:hypothetical protein